MPKLLIRHPDGRTEEHPFDGELSIGRSAGNDLLLTEGGVSRRHARLYTDDGQVFVEDLGSANGMLLDGEKAEGTVQLIPGAELVIGAYAISLPLARSTTSVVPSIRGAAKVRSLAAESADSAQAPQLRGLSGPWANQRFSLDKGRVTLGRASGVDIMLEDDSVSRRHAEFFDTLDGLVVRDLGSANGTLVNDDPVGRDEVVLKSGDIVQVGVVELLVELPGPTSGPGSIRRRDEPEAAELERGSRLKWVLVLSFFSLAGLAGAFVVFKRTQRKPSAVSASVPKDPRLALKAEVESLLAPCRAHASADPLNPVWEKAETACLRALEKNPIDPDAVGMLARVRRDKQAYATFVAAQKAIDRNADEEALAKLQEIPSESVYFARAKPKALQVAESIRKSAAEACKGAVADELWDEAERGCGSYMRIACQNMAGEELRPGPGERVKLGGGGGSNEWRPKDRLYRYLLRARMERDPRAPPWECPEIPILRRDAAPEATEEVEKIFRDRFRDRGIVAALMDFWRGRGTEATTRLQKLRDDPDKAALQASVAEVLKQVTQIQQLYSQGEAQLQAEAPEKAVAPFNEALELEKALLQEQADPYPSWYARGIRQDFSNAAYRRGKLLADERKNYREACRIWKEGFTFSTGNIDLLRAMNFCSGEGRKALAVASSCDQLNGVLDFAVPRLSEAVPGDGLADAVMEKKARRGCP